MSGRSEVSVWFEVNVKSLYWLQGGDIVYVCCGDMAVWQCRCIGWYGGYGGWRSLYGREWCELCLDRQ